ncbi:hypothetical protein [Rossellomorea vietnamensis]|uniref:Uncharacterized protein n=1 Tax=Rossellomorea vietnamensis TaxID=218284 RepID=A0A0P6WDV9_9BACI|nr:hypothetical protein [Rossellomorea vietnamensis]KPL59215.1 hypothetical protein AM506_11835 [Rossellomorea vietnamensis]
MTINKKKRMLYASYFLFITGFVAMTLVAYFLIQSIRESFYQNRFENQYEYMSLEEDGDVYPIQVFHGVKMNTFLEEKESGKKSETILFEVKDEPEAELKGFKVQSDPRGMSAYEEAIQYKVVKEKETNKESFIIAMRMTPESGNLNGKPVKYRTYSVNENGVIKKSTFTIDKKSKLETQWIRGLSGAKYGYYTDLPYQKGGTLSLIALTFMGCLFIIGGVLLRRKVLPVERNQAALG